MSLSKTRIVWATIGLFGLCLGIGLLVYTIQNSNSSDENGKLDFLTEEADEKWSSTLIESVNAGNIRKNLR